MGKIAFVFAGQGAQYSGMGKSLYESSDSAKKIYDEAELFRPGTQAQSFAGSDEELKQTINTQPCMYLVEMSAALALEDAGIKAEAVAGFSLGEIGALAYAGAYSCADGFKIVTKRGEIMHKAAGENDTAMAAVLKLDKNTVSTLAAQFEKLYAVNFNSPGQTVVSGLRTSMDEFSEKVAQEGGRVIPLAVSAAFHSPFMDGASDDFGKALYAFDLKTPAIPVYANMTAQPYTEDVANTLKNQIKNPVRWQETIENMIADGFTHFIELGPGKTLCGLIKKISKEVSVYSVQDAESLAQTIEAVKANA